MVTSLHITYKDLLFFSKYLGTEMLYRKVPSWQKIHLFCTLLKPNIINAHDASWSFVVYEIAPITSKRVAHLQYKIYSISHFLISVICNFFSITTLETLFYYQENKKDLLTSRKETHRFAIIEFVPLLAF